MTTNMLDDIVEDWNGMAPFHVLLQSKARRSGDSA